MSAEDLATRIEALEAREQIRELVARYSHGNDQVDAELFMSVWHDDARWQPDPAAGWFVGLDQIRLRQQTASRPLADRQSDDRPPPHLPVACDVPVRGRSS